MPITKQQFDSTRTPAEKNNWYKCNCTYCNCPDTNCPTGYWCEDCLDRGLHKGPLRPGGYDLCAVQERAIIVNTVKLRD